MKRTGAIVNTTLITMDPQRKRAEQGGMVWEEGEIVFIGENQAVKRWAQQKKLPLIDGTGRYVFPGLVNTHMHLFQNLLKGLGADLTLEAWWPSTIKPAAMLLEAKHLQAAAVGGTLEAIRGGSTTLVDYMYAHPQEGLSEVLIDAVSQVGARLMYARGYRNTGADYGFPKVLIERTKDVFSEINRLQRDYEEKQQMVSFMLAPAAVWALDASGLMDTRGFADEAGIPITMHMFETKTDNVVCRERFGVKDALSFFKQTRLLGDDLLAVHVVDVGARELDAFLEYGVKVSHNPVANMYLASGISPVIDMLKRNIVVGLGTDGAASNNTTDMLETMKITALLHKTAALDPTAMTADKVLGMATIEGAKAIHMEEYVGSLEVGKKADFFVFYPDGCGKSSPCHDPVASLVYSSGQQSIETVVIDGRTILDKGKFVDLDEHEAYERQSNMARDLMQKIQEA